MYEPQHVFKFQFLQSPEALVIRDFWMEIQMKNIERAKKAQMSPLIVKGMKYCIIS